MIASVYVATTGVTCQLSTKVLEALYTHHTYTYKYFENPAEQRIPGLRSIVSKGGPRREPNKAEEPGVPTHKEEPVLCART